MIRRVPGALRGAPRNVRIAVFSLAGVVALAGVGSIAAQQIRSPAQIAADAAAPDASLITAPVERRELTTEVIIRGTVRYGAPQDVVLPASSLKTSTQLISQAPTLGARLGDGAPALVVSGRPVFVLNGAAPMYRDIGPGSDGKDVLQLEQALARTGFNPGSVDGRYDSATAGAVAAFYVDKNYAPFGPTELQAADLRTAAATAATAGDALLQMRLALRNAATGVKPADINQARLDAIAAAELIPPARQAIAAADDHAAAARAMIAAARLNESEAQINANRDIALADADVTSRGALVSDAIEVQAEAQRKLANAPPSTPPDEMENLRAAVRRATTAIRVARAELTAAQTAAQTARTSVFVVVGRARQEGRRAARDLALAGAELRNARASLAIAERRETLARARVGILQKPPDTALENQIVEAARQSADRTRTELAQLAQKTGVQVPADEILFFPTLPLRVDSLTAKRGAQLNGSVMTVTNSRLAIDSSLSVGDAKLVRRGMTVTIEEPDLRIKTEGTVSRVASTPGTTPPDLAGTTVPDPARTYVEILPGGAPPSLVGASVKLGIAVQSTKGKVLAVPIGALSVSADGTSRVELDLGNGETRFVTVVPGLAAQGFVEVTPVRKGELNEGDRVVVGSGASAAETAPTGAGTDPAQSPGAAGGSATPVTPAPTDTTATPAPTPTPSTPQPATPQAPSTSAPPTAGAPGAP